jgi:hypothetical protein
MEEEKQFKNHGIDLEKEKREQDPRDWEFTLGAERECLTKKLKQPLRIYAPKGETQKGREDFMDCASRSPVNDAETKDTGLVKERIYSEGNIKWLKDNGYWNEANQGIEYSDRFIAINSGTTRNGNSLKAPVEAIRKYGMIPKKMLPARSDMTWSEYHRKEDITQEMYNLGQEWWKRFGYNYEKVFDLLRINDTVGVAGYAWPMPDNKGIYHRVDLGYNHAFLKFPDLPPSLIFDNYPDTFDGDYWKRLAEDYQLMNYGYRSIRSEKIIEENTPIINPKDMIKTIAFATSPKIYMVSNFNPKELLHIEDEASWNLLKRMGWIRDTKIADEIIADAYFPHYTILPNDLKIPFKTDPNTNPFTAIINSILNAFGLGKKNKYMETKQWYTSKVLWFNIITILIGVIQVIAKTYPIDTEALAVIMGVGNMLLRILDGQPLQIGSKTFGKKQDRWKEEKV